MGNISSAIRPDCARCGHWAIAHGFGSSSIGTNGTCGECQMLNRAEPCPAYVEPPRTVSAPLGVPLAPVSDPSETLALIAEHKLTVIPAGDGWAAADARNGALVTHAGVSGGSIQLLEYEHMGEGPTIGDAVRACVQRIKSAGDGRGTE